MSGTTSLRVLVISQYYPPETTLVPPAVAQWMKSQGHSVTVLTGFPNYPAGRIFSGYKQRWRQRETVDGIEVLRVPLFVDHSQRALPRVLNYVSFALSSATPMRLAKQADVIYVYATQMTPAFGPWLRSMFGGAPYVLHVQDLWPDSITGSSLVKQRTAGKMIAGVLAPWLRSVYRRAGAVIGIAPRMVRELVDRGAARADTSLVYNWAREAQVRQGSERPEGHRTIFLFAGNVGDMQDLATVVAAAHVVRETGVRVRIVGSGVALSSVKQLAARLGTTNVEFIDRVPPERMNEIYAEADYSLVTLKDLPVFAGTIPSKLQASLAHGLPVVTTVSGDVRDIVQQYQVGFTAEPENVESLARAFEAAASLGPAVHSAMRARALALYEGTFSRVASLAEIEKIVCRVASEKRRRTR